MVRKTSIKQIALCAGLCSVLALTSCQSSQETQPIRIGATMAQSGAYSTQGSAAKNGYELCETDINTNGGVLGRPIEFVIYDDESNAQNAIQLYEKLIAEDEVDLVMGPYGSTLTEAVAPVTEKYQMVHISPLAATSSIWEQGHRYLFMVLPPGELFLAGLIDMAATNGLKTVAIIQEDALFPKSAGPAAKELAKNKGMGVLVHETYPVGTTDFTSILEQIKTNDIDVVAMAASSLGDFIAFVHQMKTLDVNVRMFGTTGAVAEFQDALGADAEFTYGLSAWEPSLPNPGIDTFIEDYRARFNREPSFHAAGAYASCQIYMNSIENAGSLDAETIRNELLSLKTTTIFSDYAVDERGYQTANKGLFIQWQDGKKVVVWPPEHAEAEARYPTPVWSDR